MWLPEPEYLIAFFSVSRGTLSSSLFFPSRRRLQSPRRAAAPATYTQPPSLAGPNTLSSPDEADERDPRLPESDASGLGL
jgi:hypothetical protein